jgi:hypothetical protein
MIPPTITASVPRFRAMFGGSAAIASRITILAAHGIALRGGSIGLPPSSPGLDIDRRRRP